MLSTIVEFNSDIHYQAFISDRIHLWKDIWCDSSFGVRFPLLNSIAINRHSRVVDNYALQGGSIVWSPNFLRAL